MKRLVSLLPEHIQEFAYKVLPDWVLGYELEYKGPRWKKWVNQIAEELESGKRKMYGMPTAWGHRISWSDAEERKGHGHTSPRPSSGDLLVSEGRESDLMLFEFKDVDHCHDPDDMFFFQARDVGLIEDLPENLQNKMRRSHESANTSLFDKKT